MSSKKDDKKNESQEESSNFGVIAATTIGVLVGAGITYFAGRSTATENPQCNASSRSRGPSNSDFCNREKICELCTICQDDVKSVVKLPCSHFFHYSCIVPWLKIKRSCPTCREPVPPDFIRNVL